MTAVIANAWSFNIKCFNSKHFLRRYFHNSEATELTPVWENRWQCDTFYVFYKQVIKAFIHLSFVFSLSIETVKIYQNFCFVAETFSEAHDKRKVFRLKLSL